MGSDGGGDVAVSGSFAAVVAPAAVAVVSTMTGIGGYRHTTVHCFSRDPSTSRARSSSKSGKDAAECSLDCNSGQTVLEHSALVANFLTAGGFSVAILELKLWLAKLGAVAPCYRVHPVSLENLLSLDCLCCPCFVASFHLGSSALNLAAGAVTIGSCSDSPLIELAYCSMAVWVFPVVAD